MVLNFLNFCLSGNLLISPSNLNEIFAGMNNLAFSFFPFIILSVSCHSLLGCRVSDEGQLLALWVSPCMLFVAVLLLFLLFVFVVNLC